jgi:hypothetical protein
MNDIELDRLLDTWTVPPPPPTLRESLRTQFPRAERRKWRRPLTWTLVLAGASILLSMVAVGMEQNACRLTDNHIFRMVNRLYENYLRSVESWRATRIVAEIRQSNPKVYADGQLLPPLEFGHAATMTVRVPGDGDYMVIVYPRGLKGWFEAGRLHGSVIDLKLGNRQLRIECDKPIPDSDRAVFARRLP